MVNRYLYNIEVKVTHFDHSKRLYKISFLLLQKQGGTDMAKPRKDPKGRTLQKGESYRKADKTYVYRYTDALKQTHAIYSTDLMELRKRKEQLVRDQQDGLDIYVAGKSDLNAVWDRYIATKSELRTTTKSNYIYMYDHFVRESFGKTKIKDIKYSDVLFFYNHLLKDSVVKVNTLDNIHTLLHPTFQLAVRDGIIRTNPSDNVMRELKKKNGKNVGIRHALTIEQQRAFLSYVSKNPAYVGWAPLFTVMFGTGCRVGEVIGLRWEDVDFENRLININHSVTYYPRNEKGKKGTSTKCEFRVEKPKTESGIREIPMFERVSQALKEEYEEQMETGFNETVIDGMSGFIFQNRFGNVHNPQAINRAIKRIYESYNAEEIIKAKKEKREPIIIPHFSCHITRHTFCARLCENEDNLKVIMDIMGHADIQTTAEIYAEVTNGRKKKTIEKLEEKIELF